MLDHRTEAKPAETTQQSIHDLVPEMTAEEIDNLLAVLPMEQIQIMTPPATGLIMAKVRDCFETDFFLGEVLVTRTEISFDDHRAQATLMGNLPKHTLVAAALAVLEDAGREDLMASAWMASQPAVRRIARQRQAQSRLVAATRVQFESMAEED